jgi:site-specific recombinase XerD
LGPAAEASIDDLRAAILSAAHDAGIDGAANVTPECLRHTYIAFLVRQGLRFADLTRIVGPLPAETLAAYSGLAPSGSRIPIEAVDRLFPALRLAASS